MKHDNSKVHRLSRKRVDFIFKNRNGESCILSILSMSLLRINGFTPKNVSQVITGAKKSHAGYIFLDFKLPKEEKEKHINLIDITTKI